ncbi:porphobilinogen deaminase [Legionella adelaidensis]|uniref:Porphobilinogen deaminase n=1 Tax=Legionella adelaidensis TaxID=45056 RepID=A0A0W0R5Z2_9GAMM|nr:hydroxymethylbilane synthase [Legionella adelaidensis]KTC66488.1 porphobilinogen deaminase [Legionella adelaidensis]
MAKKIIRIATRKSELALWQAEFIRQSLIRLWPEYQFELIPMVTSGDKFSQNKLKDVGGKGLFVKELEEALLTGKADLAVHSMKDVPTEFPEGLYIGAICERHNPYDAFVSYNFSHFKNLPVGATIGTSSLRRQSQLLALRPDLVVTPLRGNINTRLQKLKDNQFDAIVLAIAGLERLQIQTPYQEIFTEDLMLPAAGQGALGIECRILDDEIQKLIAPLHHPDSALCINMERRVNAHLGGNCHTPVAIYCQSVGFELVLKAKVCSPDGSMSIQETQRGLKETAFLLADTCAEMLLEKGAKNLLNASL